MTTIGVTGLNASVDEALRGVRDSLTVKKVFGEPFEKNGVTVIPAAHVWGAGGGGGGEGQNDQGVGSGFGTGFSLMARPAGAYIIKGDEVSWQPALDVTRIAFGLLTYFVLRLILRR